MQVASRVSKQLKKISEMLGKSQNFMELKIFLILVKNSWKIEIELFPKCPISHEH